MIDTEESFLISIVTELAELDAVADLGNAASDAFSTSRTLELLKWLQARQGEQLAAISAAIAERIDAIRAGQSA